MARRRPKGSAEPIANDTNDKEEAKLINYSRGIILMFVLAANLFMLSLGPPAKPRHQSLSVYSPGRAADDWRSNGLQRRRHSELRAIYSLGLETGPP